MGVLKLLKICGFNSRCVVVGATVMQSQTFADKRRSCQRLYCSIEVALVS